MHTVSTQPFATEIRDATSWLPTCDGWSASESREPRAPRALPWRSRRLKVLVVGVCLLVHGARADERVSAGARAIPAQVAELRELMLSAVQNGSIEDFRAALEHSPGKPELGLADGEDPIAGMKRVSADGAGLEILAALGEILRLPPATLPLGRDIENNLIFVWPYLAERPLEQLTTREQIDLLTLVTPAKAAEMREKKRWTWWRLAIGADGSWLALKKQEN